MTPLEEAQLGLMATAVAAHFSAGILKVAAGIAYVVPQTKIGPFIIGIEHGGRQLGDSLDKAGEVAESLGEGFSMLGEVLGMRANHERTAQDWALQLRTAQNDVVQIGHQLAGAAAGGRRRAPGGRGTPGRGRAQRRGRPVHAGQVRHGGAVRLDGRPAGRQLLPDLPAGVRAGPRGRACLPVRARPGRFGRPHQTVLLGQPAQRPARRQRARARPRPARPGVPAGRRARPGDHQAGLPDGAGPARAAEAARPAACATSR